MVAGRIGTIAMLEKIVAKTLLDPLAAGRSHSRAGGTAIGYVGFEIPVELILAAGAMPVQLSGLAHPGSDAADAYLENGFAPSVRVIAEHYLQGNLDFLSHIVLPRSNDSAQRFYYYLCELRRSKKARGPEPLIYDLSKIPRDTSRTYSEQSTRRLASELGTKEADLPKAISQRNQRRWLLKALYDARIHQYNLRGSFVDRVYRAADLCDAESFDIALSDWLEENRRNTRFNGPRLLFSGSAPPDERLHRAVEAGGGNVVSEFGDFHAHSAQLPVIPEEGSISDISNHYYTLNHGPRAFGDRSRLLLSHARDAGVDGIVQWLIEEEETLVWDVPSQTKVLEEAGIPILSMVRRRWDASDGAADEIVSFTIDLGGRV